MISPLDPVGSQGQGLGVGLDRGQLCGSGQQSLCGQQSGAATACPITGSDRALGLWAGALDPWDSAVRPGPAAPGWQLVPRHRLRPPEQGLWESGLTLLIQTTHRAVSPEVCLSVSGGGGPLSAHLVPGKGWAVLGAGAAGRERSWEPEAGARDLRAGLALHFLWKPEFVFLHHQHRMRCSPALFL